jgi:membrane-associated phospholipid phosphatase
VNADRLGDAELADNIDGLSTVAPIDARAAAAAAPLATVAPSAGALPQTRTRTRWWVEALTIAWRCWGYDAITNQAPLRMHAALAHGRELLNLEQSLHIDPERALDRWLAGHHTLGVLLSYYYDNAHFVVTLGLLGYLWWRRADIYAPLRNSLVLANVIAFAVFWLFPVAPPRLLPGFFDVVAASHTLGSWHTGSLASAANQLAAMPSLHIAWAVWCTLALWRITTRGWVRALAVVYPFVTGFAVLSTGNHYVLDVLGGLATIALSVAIVRLLDGRLRWPAPRAARGRPLLAGSDPACRRGLSRSRRV